MGGTSETSPCWLVSEGGSRDVFFFDTSIKLTHLRHELQMRLMRIFTLGFGSFSPLHQMGVIWDVCISFVLFVMVHPCTWLLCFLHVLDYAGKLFACVVGRKMQIATTLKVALCKDKKSKGKLPYRGATNIKKRKSRGGCNTWLLCSSSLCCFAFPLL